jgi:hypothetical protein
MDTKVEIRIVQYTKSGLKIIILLKKLYYKTYNNTPIKIKFKIKIFYNYINLNPLNHLHNNNQILDNKQTYR